MKGRAPLEEPERISAAVAEAITELSTDDWLLELLPELLQSNAALAKALASVSTPIVIDPKRE